ncbi:MAG TPA: membrane dipeptidase [Clostridia bacterium]|nr:membrane dipeptidase [Clostridia bacterium]
MNFFDLHCDTITECYSQKKELFDNDMHVSMCKAKCLDRWCQVFAVWMPDEYREQAAIDYFDCVHTYFLNEIDKNPLYINHCKNYSEIEKCLSENKSAAILSVEGASACAGSLDRFDYLSSIGVKLITLTWNGSNEVGHGSLSGCDDGLTHFGKALVREMERKKVIIDVSHLNVKGFFDVAQTTAAPFVASHSNCEHVRSCPRNLSDEQIKVLIERNGLCGINFCDYFLSEGKNNGFEAVYKHIAHILDLGGEKILSLGSDFDGCSMSTELDSLDKMPALYEYLLSKGLLKRTVDDLFFENAYSFFKDLD